MAFVTDAFPFEDLYQRHEEDFDIEPQGPIVNIPHIQGEFLLPGDGVAAVYLRPAGDPWFRVVSPHLFRGVSADVLHQKGPGPHKAEVAFEHVPELGELVDAGAPQKPAESRETALVRQETPLIIAVIGHGAKLHQGKRFAVQARAYLPEEYRRAHRLSYKEGDDCYDRPDNQERRNGNHKIKQSF